MLLSTCSLGLALTQHIPGIAVRLILGAATAPGALWAQRGAQPALSVRLRLSGEAHCFTLWEMSRVTLPAIKPLGCWPGSHARLPLPMHRPQGNGAAGGRGRVREGCRWHRQPCRCQRGRASLGWACARGSSSSPAQLERGAWLSGLGRQSLSTTPCSSACRRLQKLLYSPHTFRLECPPWHGSCSCAARQRRAPCRSGRCSSSAAGNAGAAAGRGQARHADGLPPTPPVLWHGDRMAMGHPSLARPKHSPTQPPPPPPALLLWAQSSSCSIT